MSCITQLLEMKGDREILPISPHAVIEGGGVYKGYEYLITFTKRGNRCGYVAIPDHSRVDMSNIRCHGDITFSDTHHDAKDLLPVACNDLWIGFDAAQSYDKRDKKTVIKYFVGSLSEDEDQLLDLLNKMPYFFAPNPASKFTSKSYDYMEAQCHYIIDQLVESQAA